LEGGSKQCKAKGHEHEGGQSRLEDGIAPVGAGAGRRRRQDVSCIMRDSAAVHPRGVAVRVAEVEAPLSDCSPFLNAFAEKIW